MAEGNGTRVTGFLLMGLSDRTELRIAAFDAIYSATLLANSALLLAFRADSRLHMSMYFFLANLSLLDVSRPKATVPKILRGLPSGDWRSHCWVLTGPVPQSLTLLASVTFTLTFCRSKSVDQISACSITLGSYLVVVAAILKSSSAEGKRRAWSTCTSCLLAIGGFYGPAIFGYIRPSSGHSPGSDRLMGMVFGVLNSFVYSPRDEDVKGPSGIC
ncbi:olfactory receptor 5B12-like [Tachyglossus aculeatus]|uniref:olfactory receptor 5B12-like n=1 Tax=Tachyglossus aculeatus TaxID=9261 RepID=UPI0018F47F3D|nr:olfactory receptor 5B12-like [Tachyglossus aculeatus]XP_038597690.1 olfactory receptor 5B12-like [Tachyglossus aculeatus]